RARPGDRQAAVGAGPRRRPRDEGPRDGLRLAAGAPRPAVPGHRQPRGGRPDGPPGRLPRRQVGGTVRPGIRPGGGWAAGGGVRAVGARAGEGGREGGPVIFAVGVESVDEGGPQAVVVAGDDLKGKAPFRRLTIDLTGDEWAKKEGHTPQLLRRIAPELPLVL